MKVIILILLSFVYVTTLLGQQCNNADSYFLLDIEKFNHSNNITEFVISKFKAEKKGEKTKWGDMYTDKACKRKYIYQDGNIKQYQEFSYSYGKAIIKEYEFHADRINVYSNIGGEREPEPNIIYYLNTKGKLAYSI